MSVPSSLVGICYPRSRDFSPSKLKQTSQTLMCPFFTLFVFRSHCVSDLILRGANLVVEVMSHIRANACTLTRTMDQEPVLSVLQFWGERYIPRWGVITGHYRGTLVGYMYNIPFWIQFLTGWVVKMRC
jgi:hypothetical protein